MKVWGQVFSGGQSVRGATVLIYAKSTLAGFNIRSASVNDSGAFEFRGLALGTYELIATLNAVSFAAMIMGTPFGEVVGVRMAMAAAAATAAGSRMAARQTLDVANSDVEGVTLTMDTGFNVSGRVTIE